MSNNQNPKHSVGKGAQSEHHNEPDEKSDAKNDIESENTENQNDDNDYLEQKWKKIASDFNKNYNLDISASEFKDNSLSILTSSIFNLKDADKNHISNSISEAENELSKDEIDDQKRFILNHKVEVLKSISAI